MSGQLWRSLKGPAFLVLCFTVLASTGSCHNDPEGDGSQEGSQAMATVELNLDLQRTEIISGEALLLKAIFANTGSDPFELRVGPVSPVVYELRSPEDGQVIAVVSQEDVAGSADSPPLPEWNEEVAPGASEEIEEDPASYVIGGFPPGRYQLVGRASTGAGEVESEPVDLVVSPAKIHHLVSTFCPYEGSMALAFDHTDRSGGVWIFDHDTEREQANAGVFYRRLRALDSGSVDDLALAVKCSSESEGRWVAWIGRQSISAIQSEGSDSLELAKALTLELTDYRLVKPGFQRDDGSALFFVAGIKDGKAVVQPFVAREETLSAGPAVLLGTELPKEIIARRHEDDEGGKLQLVWSGTVDGRSRIFLLECTDEGVALSPQPREIYATDQALRALEMAPLNHPDSSGDWVHALYGPVERKRDGREVAFITYVQIPLSMESGEVLEHEVPMPADPVDAFAISGWEAGDLVILARTGKLLLSATAGSFSEWRPLAEEVGTAGNLQVAATPDGYWAGVFVDPSVGVRYAPDPDAPDRR